MLKRKVKENIQIYLFMFIGIIARIVYGIKQVPNYMQHDVVSNYGHMYYAFNIFVSGHLPNTNEGQFYHPPLNAILQSLCMRISSLFIKAKPSVAKAIDMLKSNDEIITQETTEKVLRYLYKLYEPCKGLSILYTVIILILIYLILNKLDVSKIVKTIVIAIISFYPGMVLVSGQYNNDNIAMMFFFLSIYLMTAWCKEKKVITIIFLAISIGLGMLSKISIAIVAFIIAPMMIIILFNRIRLKDDSLKKLLIQYFLFSTIVFPLGLSYVVRNYILFNQGIFYVLPVDASAPLKVESLNVIDRFLSFPISHLYDKKFLIFSRWGECNIWVNLIKTSTFDDFVLTASHCYWIYFILYILNIIFYIIFVLALFYLIYSILIKKKKFNKNLVYMSLIMIFLAVVSYVSLNIKMPYSCSEHYRYISYITFAMAVIIAECVDKLVV